MDNKYQIEYFRKTVFNDFYPENKHFKVTEKLLIEIYIKI